MAKPKKKGGILKGSGQKVPSVKGKLAAYPYLLSIKPKEAYLFRSNDYRCDGYYFTILSYFHKDGSYDDFGAFWGINRIPVGIEGDVSITCVETIERMPEGWVKDHMSHAENVLNTDATESQTTGNRSNAVASNKKQYDMDMISEELAAGASYLQCAYRIQVKAKTLALMDKALDAIERLYIDRFSTLYAASYDGEQIGELSSLLRPLHFKKGKPFGMTSTELAGSYSLVTRGIEDRGGTYIGTMTGDVNTSAILFDLNKYRHHIVCSSEQIDQTPGYRTNVPDMWGSKIAQACLLSGHKVAHVVLDGAQMDKLGPAFAGISSVLDMNLGDVNMFEMFGSYEDELSLFAMQMQKLILMAEQAYETTDADRSVIRGYLEEIATKFYTENGMWHSNAKDNREKLRVVGIPHEQVPRLQQFAAWLSVERRNMESSGMIDAETMHAIKILDITFKNLLSNNGDLFNTVTTTKIDGVSGSSRVVYDFSQIRKRGIGIMMAQLINVIAFCTGNLGEGDTLFLHGADLIDDSVKDYLNVLFSQLYDRGGRVCFLYNDNDRMLNDNDFCGLDKADYTVLGWLTDNGAAKYQDVLGQTIPAALAGQITTKSDAMTFLHREYANIVFNRDLVLWPGDDAHRIPIAGRGRSFFGRRTKQKGGVSAHA